jgi:NitT/TauT family transport system substrate-binding protein
MKKRLMVAAAGLVALAGALVVGQTTAQEKLVPVKLQLKWFPQSQFAGYFAAKERGYYKEEGLDVSFLPAGDANPVKAVVGGAADFGTTWITDFLVNREKGAPIVHIAQMFQRSGFTLVSLKEKNIRSVKDLKGKTVGIWPGGNEFPVIAALKKEGFTTSLDTGVANPDVKLITFGFDPALVFPDKVDAVSAMTYNEVNQIVGLGFPLTKVNILRLPDVGVNLLEDMIFTTEKTLAESNYGGSGLSGAEVATRLLRASIKGWNWAIRTQADAVKIVLPLCGNTCKGSGAIDSAAHQTWQMREIGRLYNAGATLKGFAGLLVPAEFDANVKFLKDLKVLTKDPDKGAVNYAIWEKATGKKVSSYK